MAKTKTKIRKNSKPGKPKTDQQRAQQGAEMLSLCVGRLSEHYTSVQIVATRLEPNGSTTIHTDGAGDIFARWKASESWLEQSGA